MSDYITKQRERVLGFIWNGDLRTLPRPRRYLIKVLRLILVMVREVATGELNLRAMSMVYTTLLAVVPLLAFSVSVLKSFGVHNQLEPLLYRFLEPLGPKGFELVDEIIGFLDNMKVGVLGSLGLGFLIYTVLSLLQKMESSFNYVWRVERVRGLGQRFSSYLSVILIGPVLIFTAMGITASMMNARLMQWLIGVEPFGTLILEFSRLVPYLLIVGAFSFIYVFIPNTRVKPGAAIVGGLVAGFLWQSTGWAFAVFIATSTNYTAIYSGFAIVLLLLIWLYINWLVLLVGAQIAFFVQHPQYLTRTRLRLMLSNRLKERLALVLMYLIADHHHRNTPSWTLQGLAVHLDLPVTPLESLTTTLIDTGYLIESNSEPPALLPARDIATIRIGDLLEAVRAADEERFLRDDQLSMAPVDALVQRLNQARAQALGDTTLRDLLDDAGVTGG
ncbi:MAG: YihY/virulence factor BrkB family protein [Gammaproteobacteria bacterium]